jgi:hypothetical protein
LRVAWFRETPLDRATPADETAAAIRDLGQTHEIDVITVDRAHDFVWKQFRAPYDLTLFEVGPHFTSAFLRPYAFHYPGVAIVSSAIPRTARGAWLCDEACINARLVIVRNEALASGLQHEQPAVPVRFVPLGVDPAGVREQIGVGSAIRVAVIASGRAQTVARALQRAMQGQRSRSSTMRRPPTWCWRSPGQDQGNR